MTILIVLAVAVGLVGIAGSVVPGIPGPPLSWVSLLLARFAGAPIEQNTLLLWLAVTTLVTLADYVLPGYMTRFMGGHKAASTGAILGLFIGMFIPPVGIILGSLLGAFLGEMLVDGTDVWGSMKAALGAFAGFILTTGIKAIACGLMFYKTVQGLFF